MFVLNYRLFSFAGVLSALGLALADVVHEVQEPCGKVINSDNWSSILDRLDYLSKCGINELTQQGYDWYVVLQMFLTRIFDEKKTK